MTGSNKQHIHILILLISLAITINGQEIGITQHIATPSIKSPCWEQLIGNESQGFWHKTNMAIRGVEIFNDELYFGTQSVNKSLHSLHKYIQKYLQIKMASDKTKKHVSMNIISLSSPFSIFQPLKQPWHNPLLMGWLTKNINRAMYFRTTMSDGCELWKYNDSTATWTQLIGDNPESYFPSGFGDKHNIALSILKQFNKMLYAGTWNNPTKGCEIWRYNGSTWEQLIGDKSAIGGGFGNPYNIGAWCIEEFKDYLYIGTMNWDFTEKGGCQIWRTNDGIMWEKVVDRGFRDFLPANQQNVHNTYAWSAEVFHDHLYVGTLNTNTMFGFSNPGCQLWRSADGITWEKVQLYESDGFGDKENCGIRSLLVFQNALYVGTATNLFQIDESNTQACEIWRYSGEPDGWTEMTNQDGFGSVYNKYAWSSTVSSDDKLWIGTLSSHINLIGPDSIGCEIWCFDGSFWTPIVKNDIGEIANGFCDLYNVGARTIIEYPQGSGKIIVGTFSEYEFYKGDKGCEVWRRLPS